MEQNNIPPQGEVNQTPESLLRVSSQMKGSLLSSMSWIQFFLIISCIGVGLLLVAALVMLVMGSVFPFGEEGIPTLVLAGVGLLYLLIAALYVYPIVRGFKLVDHTRKALRAGTNADFEASADDLHAVLKFCGILTIALLVLYILFIFVTAILAVMNIH